MTAEQSPPENTTTVAVAEQYAEAVIAASEAVGPDLRRLTTATVRLNEDLDGDLVGRGLAVCNPEDHYVARIGERLAMARALADLGAQVEARWSARSVTKAEVEARRGRGEAQVAAAETE